MNTHQLETIVNRQAERVASFVVTVFAATLIGMTALCGVICFAPVMSQLSITCDFLLYVGMMAIIPEVAAFFVVLLLSWALIAIASHIDNRRNAEQVPEIVLEDTDGTFHPVRLCLDPFLCPVTPVFQETIDIQMEEFEMAAFASGEAHRPMVVVEAYAPREARGQLDEYGSLPIKRADDDAFLRTLAAEYAGLDTGTYRNSGVPSWEWQD